MTIRPLHHTGLLVFNLGAPIHYALPGNKRGMFPKGAFNFFYLPKGSRVQLIPLGEDVTACTMQYRLPFFKSMTEFTPETTGMQPFSPQQILQASPRGVLITPELEMYIHDLFNAPDAARCDSFVVKVMAKATYHLCPRDTHDAYDLYFWHTLMTWFLLYHAQPAPVTHDRYAQWYPTHFELRPNFEQTAQDLTRYERLTIAKALLRDSQLSIKEIAERVRYSKGGFEKLFKRKVGMTVGQYREGKTAGE